MPSSGSGTMTPIGGGGAIGTFATDGIIPTLLSLDDFAKIMGINPAHFWGSASANIMPIGNNACNDLWPKYSWQSADRVSRYDLSVEIANAERDIARVVGYYPAPRWIAQENHPYPRHYRPDVITYGGYDVRGYHKSVNANFGYIVAPGQRAVTSIGTPNVVLSDEDGDGYNETATVTIATTLTDECQVKVYFAGHSGDPYWEIRNPKAKAISGGNFTATFWAWQLIDPDLWEALTTLDGFAAIDWTVASNIVTTVDVYREYNDTTATTATFYWEPENRHLAYTAALCGCGGSGCTACTLTTQDGCLHIRDSRNGIVVPEPATYSESNATWSSSSWTVCRDPDFVKIYYQAGFWDNQKRQGLICDPLSNWWKQIIAYLAVARIERPFCSCQNVTALAQHLRTDLAQFGGEIGFTIDDDLLGNPFGTRRGEVMAWNKVKKLAPIKAKVAVV